MRVTPIRHQYLRIKQTYPGAIVLFRLGDFYETFDEDARIVSRELEIVLTSREMGKGQRVPMAGIPHHALDSYLARLIHRGHKVAICEQLSPPGKGLVERGVVRVVTPGTVSEPSLLDAKVNNYLVSALIEGEQAGVAYVDITTGEFATTQVAVDGLVAELERLKPSEVVFPAGMELVDMSLSATLTPVDVGWFEGETARQTLLDHFGAASLEGYGCAHLPLAARAAGAIVSYLQMTQKEALRLLTRLTTYSTDSYMKIDAQTERNLELFRGSRSGTVQGSLLSVIDLSQTSMGGRLIRRWLGQPLLDKEELDKRQAAVEALYSNAVVRGRVVNLLRQVADLERLVNRVGGGRAVPRELVALRRSLELVSQIKPALEHVNSIQWLSADLLPCDEVTSLIACTIEDEPGAGPEEGNVVKPGFSPELDELRSGARNAKQYLANLERRERERTGIKSLRVSYNKVFGYYIEVSRSNLARVPADYIRKQTLSEAERFYTPELKDYESLILNAQDRIVELESAIFRQVCQQVDACRERILAVAAVLAMLDIFCALAEVAARYGYVRPQLTRDDSITIRNGRHPVVERNLPDGSFVANDTYLSNSDAQVTIITGPNMSGKSTYLRQVALIVLLAQIGSFIPADSATIGMADRIFTRIGAQEDLAAGQSTFMVEMIETANILNNATPRSLIILDEIGRGTSTYDGVSIARAVAEYIHNHPRLGAKTLFATHYHELVELAKFLPRVRNLNMAVTEEEGKVVFLRKVVPGGADKSYGIHVAQLAGLPRAVVHRAQEVLAELEKGARLGVGQVEGRRQRSEISRKPVQQLPLFAASSMVADELVKLDIDSLTPLDAITKLYELQRRAKEGGRD